VNVLFSAPFFFIRRNKLPREKTKYLNELKHGWNFQKRQWKRFIDRPRIVANVKWSTKPPWQSCIIQKSIFFVFAFNNLIQMKRRLREVSECLIINSIDSDLYVSLLVLHGCMTVHVYAICMLIHARSCSLRKYNIWLEINYRTQNCVIEQAEIIFQFRFLNETHSGSYKPRGLSLFYCLYFAVWN
jgi:hypothetical protein